MKYGGFVQNRMIRNPYFFVRHPLLPPCVLHNTDHTSFEAGTPVPAFSPLLNHLLTFFFLHRYLALPLKQFFPFRNSVPFHYLNPRNLYKQILDNAHILYFFKQYITRKIIRITIFYIQNCLVTAIIRLYVTECFQNIIPVFFCVFIRIFFLFLTVFLHQYRLFLNLLYPRWMESVD